MNTLVRSQLPLPLLRRGKVREVYEVDRDHLLLVASDRVSAFDIVMDQAIPRKGAVLTQISAFWFEKLKDVIPSHFVTSSTSAIIERIPALADYRDQLAGRAMLSIRTNPVPFECVIRGYITGSAWAEYRDKGTLAGEPLKEGLRESSRLDPPIFSPATKAEEGHDINVTFRSVADALGNDVASRLQDASFKVYTAGRDHAATRGIIIADTKFEFGFDGNGVLRLIDEVLTPDSSRFWPADRYQEGTGQPSFDKQPLRDYLAGLKKAGQWNGEAPPPTLPDEIVDATSIRYLDAYRRITGTDLPEDA